MPAVAADAELLVSELVTNATLHGEAPIRVRVVVGDCVRVEVEDAGRSAPLLAGSNTEVMTGRGLSMVAALASGWGVSPSPTGGKIVWAELDRSGAAPPGSSSPAMDIDALVAAWAEGGAASSPVYTVTLGAVPTELLLAAKAHSDNVARELALVREGEASSGTSLAPELAELVKTVTVDFAEARDQLKRLALASAARGEPMTELVLHLPLNAADAGERYLKALDEADKYSRSAQLLTMAPLRAQRLFRHWYVQSLVDQLRAADRGDEPAPPRPFSLVLADEVTGLAEKADASTRLALLQTVTSELADARSAPEMADAVVANAVKFLGVESARVRLLTNEGTLRSVARQGRAEAGPDPYPEYALSADLPGAQAARTGRPVHLRSLSETFAHDPLLTGYYRPGRSAHISPLAVGGQVLGLLSLTFLSGELSDEAQLALVESLSDALAQALKRAELASRDQDRQETLSLLADATQIMVTAHEPGEVLERLVALAVPRLGDWCTVYVADGTVLRRAAMVIDGHPQLAQQLKSAPLSLAVDSPHTRAFRSGQAQLIPQGVGHLLRRFYPGLDISALGGDADAGTGLCVPIKLRGRPIGVIGLTFLGSGRKVTPHVTEALSGLADRAAIAFDQARHWSAQQQLVQTLMTALLPDEPLPVPGMSFAARYRPAGGDVAGDWWEVQPMPDGTVLIGLGDAAGHGLPAVSRMSELRHGARALAAIQTSPSVLLADLNRLLTHADAGFATAVYGRLSPSTGELCWASAGHLPPLHVSAEGAVALLEGAQGSPLGAPSAGPAADARLQLRPGDTLVLYSDGVVERRHRDLGRGIDHLVSTVTANAGSDLDELADAIMAAHCTQPIDDCCLLLLRRNRA
jgi:GAF domain-containing protein